MTDRRSRFLHRGLRRARDQRGVAMIEMTVVVFLLAVLLFGIITFGVTLSFKQSMTQATDDAARAAAVAPAGMAQTRAEAAANRSAGAWGERCGEGGLTCSFIEEACTEGGGTCLQIKLTYDLKNHPRVPIGSLLDGVLPDEMTSEAVVEVTA